MVFSWVAVEALTGNVIADLPDLTFNQGDAIRQTIGRYETATPSLPLPTAPENWQRAVTHGASNLVLLSQPTDAFGNLLGQPNPVWGATVIENDPDETDLLPLSLVTLEGYLDRQFIGNKTYAAVGQNDIVADLITSFVGSAVGGIPIRVQYVTAGSGTARDRTYADQDDKTVYSALTDLMGVVGGPEWYIGWEHQSAPERYTPVLYVGDRIGTAVMPGMGAAATFEMPGPVKSFKMVRSYADGKGANSVTATSSGQGTTRPQSPAQIFADPQRPKYEYRWTPSTSISVTATLTGWAQQALADQKNGSIAIALNAVTSDPGCPQLGVDWNLGDDVGFNIGPDQNGNDVPAFPGGYQGVGRVIGYQLTLDNTPIVTPVIAGGNVV